ncbi:metalloregulator ArsR/SmtB family transcription factor [Ectothiorhodospira sp. BSL-9]|uniref:ArsR/SmtB family transcription factor n=1 Tax=Ectothiorhodospira sp. BSL-9 TaxID=1442136 RepID=UPI0007B44831|nr:metalloregulator ArsR/SmtB family transcription factor [Ectothiorhodospira sp. BSL-9]ANB02073.1 ArsR family transcriptional regulator [Ectothiorhodospira sp. BSL-9]TVQ68655.1 MAG: ArsR family transcriptional regulator [Chromatiaceae bacterium]
MTQTHRTLQDLLYEQVARIGKALSSPKRLEILDLLAQGEKSVDRLAEEAGIDIKLASAHLRVLKEGRLVMPRRQGRFIFYRLSGQDVASLNVMVRSVAEQHLLELRATLEQMSGAMATLDSRNRTDLLAQARQGEVVVIDVRPPEEFEAAHLPFARSLPLAEIEARLAELPLDREIVAYCRGPFCVLSDEAVALLRRLGYRAHKLSDGVSEWQAAGLPLESRDAISPTEHEPRSHRHA